MDVNCAVHVLQISSTQKWKNRILKQCRLGEVAWAHVWKTPGGAVCSITIIYSLGATVRCFALEKMNMFWTSRSYYSMNYVSIFTRPSPWPMVPQLYKHWHGFLRWLNGSLGNRWSADRVANPGYPLRKIGKKY